ncbi:MAG: glycosyltransferase family 2 protein [Acidimicrobiales bacterium]
MNTQPLTATIAIATYRRPASLAVTLDSLRQVGTRPDAPPNAARNPPHRGKDGCDRPLQSWQIHDITIIDNDVEPTAAGVVAEHAAHHPHRLRYVHAPEPGLAAVRNRALDEAAGDVLVFIDDDEVAVPPWPDGLIRVMAASGAVMVGGPVRTRFAEPPEPWVTEGGFFDRAEPADGSRQRWLRSGNLAIDVAAVRSAGLRFDPRFGTSGGEDTAFTRSADHLGLDLRWSADAVVVEEVGPDRTTLQWLCARQRRTMASWVRVERDLHPGLARIGWITTRGVVRMAAGTATAAIGAGRANRVTRNRGLITAARGLGALQGLLVRPPRAYH